MLRALDLMVTAISECSAWFIQILNAVDGYSIWASAIFVYLSYKFLFAPLFGMAKSDVAKKSYNAFRRRKEE